MALYFTVHALSFASGRFFLQRRERFVKHCHAVTGRQNLIQLAFDPCDLSGLSFILLV